MRAAKHAAGWERAFTLFKDAFQSSKKDKLQFLLDTLHEQYIEKRVANGLTYEEAERHCEKEYMSFAFHYKGRIDPFSGKRVLIKATKTFVDMSPQAATDLMTLASQADFPKKHADRLHKANRGPWDLCKNGSARFELTDAIHALRDAEIERQLQANGGDKERAEFAANGSYIGINQHFSNDITYTLYTRGAYDVARRAREQSQALAR